MLARVADAADAYADRGLSVQTASAVRLLYAALQSLNWAAYWQFVESLHPYVRERLTIPDVLDFLRIALEVPADEYLLLVPLIDKAHRAKGSFGGQDRGQKVTQLSCLISIGCRISFDHLCDVKMIEA